MSTDQITIRQLGYTDLPQVIGIERSSFPTPWSLAMFVLELSKPSSICLAAVHTDDAGGEKLAGYLICARYADVWHVMNIAIDPNLRRRGIAASLMQRLMGQAGLDAPYTLEVRPSNAPAIALYERLGFQAAGMRPRYYRDTGEDALIMWRGEDAAAATETRR